jgi:hypothetical protein
LHVFQLLLSLQALDPNQTCTLSAAVKCQPCNPQPGCNFQLAENRIMTINKRLIASIVATGLLLGANGAQAHCDSLDGPVARVVQKALEDGNIIPVLTYAPAAAESEVRTTFERSRMVRGLGPDAQALADQAFLETVIRLHRAGEGAAYAGLKPAGTDYGPVIPAAEQAVETGDVARLMVVLGHEIEHALRERLAQLQVRQKVAPREATTDAEVPHVRERVSAELAFVSFAENIRQAALGKGAEQHVD